MPEYPSPIPGLPSGRVDVLIVEDERELAEATAEYLDAMGISSHHEPTAEAALDVLSRREAGVVLLDVNLPGDSGFAFCRQLRQASQVPVIFISARGSEDDQVLALSVGGDDYIIKPFSLAVLAAKISRMLSRSGQHTAGFDDGRLDGFGCMTGNLGCRPWRTACYDTWCATAAASSRSRSCSTRSGASRLPRTGR